MGMVICIQRLVTRLLIGERKVEPSENPEPVDIFNPDNWMFQIEKGKDSKIVRGSELSVEQRYIQADAAISRITEQIREARRELFMSLPRLEEIINMMPIPLHAKNTLLSVLTFEGVVFMRDYLQDEYFQSIMNDDPEQNNKE